jgi:hypothetical protein
VKEENSIAVSNQNTVKTVDYATFKAMVDNCKSSAKSGLI